MKLHVLYEKIAESLWRAMSWVCHAKNDCSSRFLDESVLVEKYEMVAIPTHKNDEKRS